MWLGLISHRFRIRQTTLSLAAPIPQGCVLECAERGTRNGRPNALSRPLANIADVARANRWWKCRRLSQRAVPSTASSPPSPAASPTPGRVRAAVTRSGPATLEAGHPLAGLPYPPPPYPQPLTGHRRLPLPYPLAGLPYPSPPRLSWRDARGVPSSNHPATRLRQRASLCPRPRLRTRARDHRLGAGP